MLKTFVVAFMGFMGRGRLIVVAWAGPRSVRVVGWWVGSTTTRQQPPVCARPSRR